MVYDIDKECLQEARDIAQGIKLSHKERVAKLNNMLSTMPEAYDLPRVTSQ